MSLLLSGRATAILPRAKPLLNLAPRSSISGALGSVAILPLIGLLNDLKLNDETSMNSVYAPLNGSRPLHGTTTTLALLTRVRSFHTTTTTLQVRQPRRPSYISGTTSRSRASPRRIREPPARLKKVFDAHPELTQDVVALPPTKESDTLTPSSPASSILNHGTFVIGRKMEMMNLFLGIEQANTYLIRDVYGNEIGAIAEDQGSLWTNIQRQLFSTHRSFTAYVVDKEGKLALKIYRPFTLINSKVMVFGPEDELIGEVHQIFHIFRRKYELFVGKEQFAKVDAPFLSWDFRLVDGQDRQLGSIDRNFSGLMREMFTDTGVYVLRCSGLEDGGQDSGLSLDERAVTLAAAITVDFDFFSRSAGRGGLFWFLPGFGGGEEADGGGGGGSDWDI